MTEQEITKAKSALEYNLTLLAKHYLDSGADMRKFENHISDYTKKSVVEAVKQRDR